MKINMPSLWQSDPVAQAAKDSIPQARPALTMAKSGDADGR